MFYFPAYIILYTNFIKKYEKAFCRGLTHCLTCYHCRRLSRKIDNSEQLELVKYQSSNEDKHMQNAQVFDTAEAAAPLAIDQARNKETEQTNEAAAPWSLRMRSEDQYLSELTNPQDNREKASIDMQHEGGEQ